MDYSISKILAVGVLSCLLTAIPMVVYALIERPLRRSQLISTFCVAVLIVTLFPYLVSQMGDPLNGRTPTEVARAEDYSDPSLRAIAESRERAFRLYPFLNDSTNPWSRKLDDYVKHELARSERAEFFRHLDWPERIVIEFLAKNALLNSDGTLKKL